MIHLLQRHSVAIKARLAASLVLAYALPAAGLQVAAQRSVTPFVRCFILSKPARCPDPAHIASPPILV